LHADAEPESLQQAGDVVFVVCSLMTSASAISQRHDAQCRAARLKSRPSAASTRLTAQSGPVELGPVHIRGRSIHDGVPVDLVHDWRNERLRHHHECGGQSRPREAQPG
jgi:hypothetical protein